MNIKKIPEPLWFEEIYSKLQADYCRKLRMLQTSFWFLFALSLLFIASVPFVEKIFISASFMFPFVAGLAAGGAAGFFYARYIKQFKNHVLKTILEKTTPASRYTFRDTSLSLLAADTYKHATSCPVSFRSRYICDDCLRGLLNDGETMFYIWDLLVKELKRARHGRKIYHYWRTVFHGLIANAKVTYTGKDLKITPAFIYSKERVEMDSAEFEKIFNVHCEDRTFAMQLLTADSMQELVDFWRTYKEKFSVTINYSGISFKFYTRIRFEPLLIGNPLNRKLLFKYFCMSDFVVKLSEFFIKELKLKEI